MKFSKTFLRVIGTVFILLFLISILTVESEQINRNSNIKYPVCVDSGIELAIAAHHDTISYLPDASPGFFVSPDTGHIVNQFHLSSHLYRGPPATHIA